MVAPNGWGPQARGTESHAQVVVAPYGAPAGDGCPQRRVPTDWGPADLAQVVVAAYGPLAGDGSL